MIRAYVTEDFPLDSVKVAIVQQPEGGRPEAILRLPDDPTRFRCWEPIEPDSTDVAPTMTLRRDEAQSLLDSLTRFFHGAEDTRALRKDYEAERGRVDQLVGTLTVVTQTLATRATEIR